MIGKLAQFWDELWALAPDKINFRPFVCEGNPFECKAFVVGINPATGTDFRQYWSSHEGFNKQAWFASYKVLKPAISPTRRRLIEIEKGACPLKVLETNIFAASTRSASDLQAHHKIIAPFEFLLTKIRPAVVLVHGKPARLAIERMCGGRLGPVFTRCHLLGVDCLIAAVPHLAIGWSLPRARALGTQLKAAAIPSV